MLSATPRCDENDCFNNVLSCFYRGRTQTDLSTSSAAATSRIICLLSVFPSSTLAQAVQLELLLPTPLVQFPSTKSSFVICLALKLTVENLNVQPFWSETSNSSGSQEPGDGSSFWQRLSSSWVKTMERLLPKATATVSLVGGRRPYATKK